MQPLEQLYIQADFLLFPTRNDCFGIAVCEASAYGLPVLAANTGGVPGVVPEGENGFLLPYSAGGAEYAELVAKIYRDGQLYAELVKSSRATFDTLLNWDAWGVTVRELIAGVVHGRRSSDEMPVVSTS